MAIEHSIPSSQLLSSALSYAEHGFHVFPVRPNRKEPIIRDWPNRATTDEATIREWWSRDPDANIGIATGPSRLVVIDVDTKNGSPGLESWRDILEDHNQEIGETVTAKTPTGGLHIYYRADGSGIRNSAGRLSPGIDVRAEGGYIIAPPSIHPDGGEYRWALGGAPDDVGLLPLPVPLANLLTKPMERRAGSVSGVIPQGQRNETLTSLAGTMRRRGMSESAILAALQATNQEICQPPLPDAEVEAIAHSISRYEPKDTVFRPQVHKTDLGNARRLVARHGEDLRYCAPLGGWMLWTGKRWEPNPAGAVERMAKETALSVYKEAHGEPDADRRKALAKWATVSESAPRLRAVLELAWSEPDVCVDPEVWDAYPWLLNCLNGTIDLRTGELREHRREDMMTKLAPVEYDATLTDALFERYLQDTTEGDTEFAGYLQRAVGYSLTGLTDEEDVFLVLGPGGSGKTTLVEALLTMLGDYGMKASFDTFLVRRNVGGPRPDLVRLRGARLVAASEPEKGRHLAEMLIKELSGGDTYTVRDLYQSPFSFKPMFKLWLVANDAPAMSDDDSGLWRRLKRLPFEHEIPEEKQDPQVKRHLCSPEGGSALLAWAVAGSLAWQRQGLRPCAIVQARTTELRADMNPLGEFLQTCCVVERSAKVPAAELRAAYEEWAAAWGQKAISNREWGKRLRSMKCSSARPRMGGKKVTYWMGIGLLPDGEEPAGHNGQDGRICLESAHATHITEKFMQNPVYPAHPAHPAHPDTSGSSDPLAKAGQYHLTVAGF